MTKWMWKKHNEGIFHNHKQLFKNSHKFPILCSFIIIFHCRRTRFCSGFLGICEELCKVRHRGYKGKPGSTLFSASQRNKSNHPNP